MCEPEKAATGGWGFGPAALTFIALLGVGLAAPVVLTVVHAVVLALAAGVAVFGVGFLAFCAVRVRTLTRPAQPVRAAVPVRRALTRGPLAIEAARPRVVDVGGVAARERSM